MVIDNLAGQHFWTKQGFHQVRSRFLEAAGHRNEILVLIKACGTQNLADYLELVPRDQPDSSLP